MEQLSRGRKTAITICAGLALAALGIWGGMMIEQGLANKSSVQGESIRTTIAVVNMDDGVQYNGKYVNYTNAFIPTLGDDVTVVSAAAAADGFKNGVYGGILTIPADMSSKIVSINAENPAQVALNYEINDHLPRDKYLDVYQRINNAQQSLRSSLAYVFETSIFEDIHTSQANVGKVTANDKADLGAVDELRQTNFMVGLKIADVPDVKPDYQNYEDTKLIVGAGDTLAQGVDSLYDAEYGTMQESYDSAGQSITTLQGTIAAWQSSQENYLSSLGSGLTGYQDQLDTYRSALEVSFQELAAYKNSVDAYGSQAKPYHDALDTYYSDLQKYQKDLDAYRESLESVLWLSDTLNTYRSEIITTINGWCTDETTETPVQPIPGHDLTEELPKVESYVSTITVPAYTGSTATPLSVSLPSLETSAAPDVVPSMPGTVQTSADTLSALINEPPSNSALAGGFVDLNTAIATYDPLLFFTERLNNDVDRDIATFGSSVSTLNSGLESKQSENVSKLGQSHSDYQTYVLTVVSDTLAKYDEDGKSLGDALSGFYKQKLTASETNEKLFANISGLLPYSQVNGAVNQRVTEFIVDPLAVEQKPYLGTASNGFNLRGFLKIATLILAGISAVAILCLWLVRKRQSGSAT